MFSRVLIANRGEIVVRIARTLRALGIESIGVYGADDADAVHVRAVDRAVALGGSVLNETYLSPDALVAAATSSGAEAVHPGYGFLAESAEFAEACAEAGLVFIGPPADVIRRMGSKTQARRTMRAAGVPVVPGSTEAIRDTAHLHAVASAVGFPLVLKASNGGGGKGFRIVRDESELDRSWERASAEALRYFGDDAVYIERLVEDARHVEVQILADAHGTTVHLLDRDCSVQRRQQKLVEEAPAPTVDAELRERICRVAVDAATAVGYRSLGTVEGLLAGEDFYFLEMNTRIQVEHPVTEMITGRDLVADQIRVAAGEPLGFTQADIVARGHAIECRINAEDASRGFLPSPGTVMTFDVPEGEGVRVDSGVEPGSVVSPRYDSLIAKLIVWGEDREQATRRMLRALDELHIEGPSTLVPFHRRLLSSRQWAAAETCADLVTDPLWLKEVALPAKL
ncbi:acetyl/propionyl/methylcrotonyl-CoA carboxylase subunit alpha [Microbacterium fluvii]|uniref:biotin carboxylase n=1 Tax=Microbacterium fluvii TaxID=415215 RepID=A0ABW2HAR1_9MICO|nr:acetyl-CoA carboxylase biotin carboxylase subunit [Microbacterium fluvii]MCU4671166.1 acetyl-CoA carboxylase biotin carboxylase subunit [Microbacterium fluvii]